MFQGCRSLIPHADHTYCLRKHVGTIASLLSQIHGKMTKLMSCEQDTVINVLGKNVSE